MAEQIIEPGSGHGSAKTFEFTVENETDTFRIEVPGHCIALARVAASGDFNGETIPVSEILPDGTLDPLINDDDSVYAIGAAGVEQMAAGGPFKAFVFGPATGAGTDIQIRLEVEVS